MSKGGAKRPFCLFIALLSIALCLRPPSEASAQTRGENVLEADSLDYDEKNEIMTARGRVIYSDDACTVLSGFLRYDAKKEILSVNKADYISLHNFDKKGSGAILYARELVYEKNRELFTASGQVKLSFDDNIFYGERLEYSKADGSLILTGPVRLFTKDGKEINGGSFVYDVEKKEGQVDKFTHNFIHNGTLYLSNGQSLTYNDRETVIRDASVTTCDLGQPHYRFHTDKLVYYPGKKIVFYDNAYFQGDKRLLHTARMVVGLRNGEPVLPVAGYGYDEGLYIKFRNYYDLSGSDYGVIYKDIMSLKGLGLGFREYRYGRGGRKDEFSLYASYNPLNDNKGFKGEWQSKQKGLEQMLSFERKTVYWPDDGRQFHANWSFMAGGGAVQTSANLNYFSHSGVNGYSYLGGNINQSIKNSDELRTFWDYSFFDNTFQNNQKYTDSKYSVRMEYTKPSYMVNLSFNENKYGFDYSPKLTYQTTLDSPWQFGFATARVRQNYTDIDVWQTDFTAEFRGRTKKIGKNTFLLTNAYAARTLFSDSHSITNYRTNTTLFRNISAKSYWSTSLLLGQSRGYDSTLRSPFNQDFKKVTTEVSYIFDENYRMNAGFSYDFTLSRPESFVLSLDGRTFPFWNWTAALDYDARMSKLRTAGLTFTLNQSAGLTGYVKLDYDAQINKLREASVRIEGDIGKNWAYSVKSDYFSDGAMINIAEIKLIRKMHCQDFILNIYPHDRLFFVEVNFKHV